MSGRIAKYDDSDYQAIITDLANGVPLNKAWGGTRPGKTLFHRRVAESAAFAQEYDRAMVLRAQVRIARIEDVIEDVLAGRAEPAACKVALDSLWKLAAKEDPRRYSDVQRQEISGAGGKDLIPESQQLSEFEFSRLLVYLIAKGAPPEVDAGDLLALPMEAST
jgi:hypothetical protein